MPIFITPNQPGTTLRHARTNVESYENYFFFTAVDIENCGILENDAV